MSTWQPLHKQQLGTHRENLLSYLGIIVNPMSGRDVRRVAAKASTSTHHEKSQLVKRLVLGALEQRVDRIYLANEPFRINERAIENLQQRDKVEIFDFPISHSDKDTVHMVNLMWDAGCRTFIVLGGDGTNRVVAKTKPGAIILPLSTGTNNVFPLRMEASVAGAAAGLVATGKLKHENHCFRCKQIHISINGILKDIALIDVVLLKDDMVGNLLPFAPDKLCQIFLTRAEPASIGMSPIGGYLIPCNITDNFGVMISCGEQNQTQSVRVPLSAGLYGEVPIIAASKMALGQTYLCPVPGILAFDGDRSIELGVDDTVEVTIRKDGPWIVLPDKILSAAAQHGLLASVGENR
jgi:hypothetical protein